MVDRLHSGSSTVSVISIPTDASLPQVVATVNLADSLSGKSVTLTPSTIVYSNGYLLVGCEGIKGNIVVNTSGITEAP